MEDQQYNALMGELRSLREEVQGTRDEIARVDRDLTKDRHDLEDFRVKLGGLDEQIVSMKRLITGNVDDVGDRVTDALRPAMKEVASLKQEIKNKKSIVVLKEGFFTWLMKPFHRKVVS